MHGALVEPVALQHVQDGDADSGRQRVRDVRGEEQESPVVRRLFEFRTGQHGGQRKAGTECLGQGQYVGDDAVALEGVPGAGAA